MSLKAYQQTQQATETHSQTEYRLFAEITRELMEAKECDKLDQKLHNALHRNRRLWSTLATDCAVEGNQLPAPLRAQIISLSIFVGKYSSQVVRDGQNIQALIDINKNVMEGLAMQSRLRAENQARENAVPAGAAASQSQTSQNPQSPQTPKTSFTV